MKKITLIGRLILVFACLGAIFNIHVGGQEAQGSPEWKNGIKNIRHLLKQEELSLLSPSLRRI